MALFGSDSEDLKLKIGVQDDATAKLNVVTASVGKLAAGFTLGNIATSILNKGFSALTNIVDSSIASFEESEKVTAQLAAVLESTGHAAGLSQQALEAMAKSLQNTTTYSDEAITSAESMLLTFTNIGKNVFPDATEAVLNMSTALGQDLKSGAIQLGKALNNPIEGIQALSRVGVQFTNEQKDQIETLVKSGQTMEAQKLILKELSNEFGGSAAAAAKTFSGQIEQAKNRLDDINEQIGHALLATMASAVDAFSRVTAEMFGTTNIASILLSALDRVAENFILVTGWVIKAGIEIVRWGSYVVEVEEVLRNFFSGISDGWESITGRFNSFREGLDNTEEGIDTFGQTFSNNMARAQSSLDAAGASSEEFAGKAPAAYQATAAEAQKAATAIEDANKQIDDTKQKLQDLIEGHLKEELDTKTAYAEAFVKQEQNVADLKKQIAEEEDFNKRTILQQQLVNEQNALERGASIQTQLADAVTEARRRAAETDFEREIEDIAKRQKNNETEFSKKLALIQKELDAQETKRAKLGEINAQISANAISESDRSTNAIIANNDRAISSYNALANSASRAGGSSVSYGSTSGSTISFVPSPVKKEFGGVIDAPLGTPVPIIAHGQETIIPAGQSNGGGTYVVNVVNPVVRNDSDIQRIREVIDSYFRPLLVNYKITS